MVFGSDLADFFGRADKDEDPTFAQDAPPSGQFAQQWELRMVAQEEALGEIAAGRLRRLLAFNKSFTCTDVKIGATALFYKVHRKESAPRRRGPALILDIDETGVTAKLRSQIVRLRGFT